MRHIVFEESDQYPIALLIKSAAFNKAELEKSYLDPLLSSGISPSDVVALTLEYNSSGKVPVKFVKGYLETLMPSLESIGTTTLYCADATYFKVLTGARKAEPHLGYVLPCKLAGYEHMNVILGVNHRSIMYNPANLGKLQMSMETLITHCQGSYSDPGTGIIHAAHYPDTVEGIREALDKLHKYPELSADIEAFSLKHDKSGIGTITFCWSEHEGIAFSCDYAEFPASMTSEERLNIVGAPLPDYPDSLDDGVDAESVYRQRLDKAASVWHGYYRPNQEVRELLRQFFETYQGNMKWHNCTYDIKCIITTLWMKDLLDTPGLLNGLEIMTERFDDTKIITYLAVNSCAGNKLSLKDQAHEFAGNYAQEEIKDIRRIPLPELLEYNLVDGLSTNYTYNKRYPEMVRDQQEDLYLGLMKSSLRSLIQIELTGMPLCPKRVQEVRKELETIRDTYAAAFDKKENPLRESLYPSPVAVLEKRIQQEAMVAANSKLKTKQHPLSHFAHMKFNPNSGPQKQKLLYEIMELPVIDVTKSKAPAVGGDTLEKLTHHTDNPEYIKILEALMGFTEADKILGTFIKAFEEAIDKGQEVVWLHGSFNLGGTKSGRLSSSDPNLQNLPSGSTYGKLIKSCFVAPKGWLFAGADFNSLEDYISALTTKDPNKLKVYLEGYDGHGLRAFSYWPEKFPYSEITPELSFAMKEDPLLDAIRSASKGPTFALTYQGTKITLMRNLGFSEEEASRIEENYHELYKVSDEWVQVKLDQAARDGYVTVAFGLRLRTPLLSQTLRNHSYTPYEAEAEGRTAGNALGQSYGLLNNRACNEFMEKVWNSPYRFDILPVALIHDAIYLLIRDDVEVVEWTNRELIASMQWQELPEIQHDEVKLGAALDIFWPSWATTLTLPNDATQADIRKLTRKHIEKVNQKQKEAA